MGSHPIAFRGRVRNLPQYGVVILYKDQLVVVSLPRTSSTPYQ